MKTSSCHLLLQKKGNVFRSCSELAHLGWQIGFIDTKKGQKKFLAAPKMVSYSQLPAVKKDTIFSAARKFFGTLLFRDGFRL